ncbi:MAG TPA: amino acid adenylation domain-containing protein [Bacilli bacterium]|nr:amino acid adenylation domain-containing protein [Bacilli bacterium]
MNYLSKENVQEVIGMSYLQEHLLLGQKQPHTARKQTRQVAWTLAGSVNAERAQQAWEQVIAKRPSLRSVFRLVKNRDVQIVLKQRPVTLETHDLRGREASEQQAELVRVAAAQNSEPFDVTTGPLVRVAWLQTQEEEAVLLVTYHEMIADDASRKFLLADFLAAYESLTAGEEWAGEPQSSDKAYLAWLAKQDWTATRKQWGEEFTGYEAPTGLLYDHTTLRLHSTANKNLNARPEESGESRESGTLLNEQSLTLPADVAAALQTLSEKEGVSQAALLQAAWALLLSVYSNEERVSFGFTVPGRPHDVDGAATRVGAYGNTLPLFADVKGEMRVRDFLAQVEAQQTLLQESALIPLAKIRSFAGVEGDAARYDSVLSVEEPVAASGGLLRVTDERFFHAQEPRLAIRVTAGRGTGALKSGWHLRFFHQEARLSSDCVRRMMRHLQTVLTSLARQPEATLGELNLLPDEERERLFDDFNRTQLHIYQLDRFAHELIEEQVAQHPTRVAATCSGQTLTYADLNARANRLAHWLRGRGVGRDDIVALLAERNLDMLIAILAVLKAGAAYVPLDSAHPDARIATILQSSRAKVILTQEPLAERSKGLANGLSHAAQVFTVDAASLDATLADQPTSNPERINEPHDLANVFFTSGSTGQPKGAMVEHIGMLNHLWAKIDLLELNESSVVVQNASHCFDISVWQFLAPLMVGGQVAIYENDTAMDSERLFEAVQTQQVTVLEMVPAMIEMFLQTAAERPVEKRSLPALHYMISTGEGLSVALCQKWLASYPSVRVVNTYGATECSDDTSHQVIDGTCPDDDLTYVALGSPIPNFRHYLLDDNLRPVPMGCVGEVCMTGIGVGRGYLNDPERTAQAFLTNPFDDGMGERMYRTGDLARILPDGRFVFVSRADFQVKVRGHRIELGEIEAALLHQPSVAQCIAVVRPDAEGQNRILAYIVPQPDAAQADIEHLRTALQTRLPDYMLPERILVLDAMPLNRNGKIDRKQLPDPDDIARSGDGEAQHIAPSTATETALAAIWSDVLDIPKISVDANFFALGGHSLKLMQIRSRIKRQLGHDVHLQTLFDHQTVRDLAATLETLQANGGGETASATGIPTLPPADHYPLSHAQKRLFLIHQLEPHNTTYHLPTALELLGELNIEAVHHAFQTIVDRHAILRSSFELHEGEPVQRIAKAYDLPCPLDDLTRLSSVEQDDALQAILQREQARPFHLEKGSLFRVGLVKRAADRHILLLNMHHIVSDGWSGQVLLSEFRTLYESYSRNQPNPLPPLAIQYVDYASWQNERIAGGDLDEAESYWVNQYADEPPVLNLPSDRPRPPVQSFRGATEKMRFSQDLLHDLQALCKQQDITLFMGLLSVVGLFLSRLSTQDDIVIGTPEAGRNQVELEELIGFFVNTLALRLDLSGNPTFDELLARVKQTALDAYAHQEYPFDKLVNRVNPTRDLSRSPLFSVMFQVLRADDDSPAEGLSMHELPIATGGAHFDLSIIFTEHDDHLAGSFEYSTDLFDRTTILRWIGHFETLLRAALKNTGEHIATLPLLSEQEQKQMQGEGTSSEAALAVDTCVHELLEAQAKRTPEGIALECDGATLTYADLNRRANQLARHLRHQGVGTEALVGLCLERSLELVIGMLGILKAGAAFVPLDPTYPAERIQYILEDAQLSVLVTQHDLVANLSVLEQTGQDQSSTLIRLDTEWTHISEQDDSDIEPIAQADNLAYLIYTSGSTGRPKAVMVEHGNLVSLLQATAQRFPFQEGDVMPWIASVSFDIALFELFSPLLAGGTSLILTKEHVLDMPRLLNTLERCTHLHTVPTLMRQIVQSALGTGVDEHTGRFQRLRQLFTGGEAVPPDLLGDLNTLFPQAVITVLYGPTEATILATSYTTERSNPVDKFMIGHPFAHAKVRVYDVHQALVPIGVPGELYIGGHAVTRGYRNRPELTAEKFVTLDGECWYRSGDLVRRFPDGHLEFLGRIDNQVKIRGYRIELGEIEVALSTHPAVKESVVIAREDLGPDKRLVAYAVLTTDASVPSVTVADLRRHLATQLPEFMVPAHILLLDTLPLSANGKIDRKQLPAPELDRVDSGHTFVAPRDPMELEMAKIWENVLNIRPIGIHDNFFTLGGHSLQAVVLMENIRRHFEVEIPLSQLFQAPNVADLCATLRGEDTVIQSGILIPMQIGDSQRPPLFLIHPQGGGVLPYIHLVKALGTEQTVYGLQSVGYETEETPLETVDRMADRYLHEIKRVAPEGPYRLAGWSAGGTIAYEVARRLEEEGEKIEFFGLLDVMANTQVEQEDIDALQERSLVKQAAALLGLDHALFVGLGEEEALEKALEHAESSQIFPEGVTLQTFRRKLTVAMQNGIAAFGYRPAGSLKADIHLFRVSAQVPGVSRPHPLVEAALWNDQTEGQVHVIPVRGHHLSMVQPPHVELLAKEMENILSTRTTSSVSS